MNSTTLKNKITPILLLLFFLSTSLQAQQIYLPDKIINDTAALKKHMPILAATLLNRLHKTAVNERDMEYFGCMFSLQLLAEQYQQSLQSIDSIRANIAAKPGFSAGSAAGFLCLYDTYNNIQLMRQAGEPQSTVELFKMTFPVVLDGFKGKALEYATEPFLNDQETLAAEWQQAISKVQFRAGDSVSYDEAIIFSQAFTKYLVYQPFLSPGKVLIRQSDLSNYMIQDSTMITMRDGVKLAAVIVQNKYFGKSQPVVMMSNIYASTEEVAMAKQIANQGYIGIILNTRGKYISTASIEPWEHDAEDTYDAIDWISKQSWCNGKIGMYGGSYLGFSQWAAVKKLHPALKTIVPQVAAAPGIDFPYTNGIASAYSLRWSRYVTNHKLTDQTDFQDSDQWYEFSKQWFTSGKAFNSLDSMKGKPNVIFQKWLKHPSYDRYWQKMTPYQKEFSKISIPVLSITGYFDGDQDGSLHYFNQHNKWNTSANHYLLIGPYDHLGAQHTPSAVVNGYKIDPSARISINDLVFQWFNYTLKDSVKPEILKDKVNYQVMGTDTWAHVPSFQQMNNDTLNFYFSEEKDGEYYKLDGKASKQYIQQQFDFSKRIPSKWSSTNSLWSDSLSSNEVIFSSEILSNDISINGTFNATLFAVINKKDMDLEISLYEQQSDGKYFMLSGTIHRASYANNSRKRKLLRPGKMESIPVQGKFISKKIPKGSRLILAISPLNNVFVEVNHGTGKSVSNETIKDADTPLTIHWSGKSNLQIPIKR
ncbi:CocE/NonD family hydrolase [Pedobacter sp. N36a]|uniref:CocE/NonD family hydrolase n=1 Tax=Pedobacter sp. N36a TaxID=2767996 RepID=UPI001656EFAF|nr:CocE/NonD family hydrolase [Pedobacter sp. N36a]MBC8985068.1 CocE/NonD family hydrolase [Pedobacter sp. N36a]